MILKKLFVNSINSVVTTIALTVPLFNSSANLAQATVTAVSVGGNDACQLDWGEVNAADSTGWNFTGDLGDRNDLFRVYHHTPSGLYLKISVAQRWNWNGKKAGPGFPEMPDDNRFVPKITDYSHYGTGGYQTGEYLFAMGLNTTNHDLSTNDGQNTMTIEFFNDAALTNKAQVDTLNFVTTDVDSSANNTEQIIVEVEDIQGNNPYIHFDRPTATSITDDLIDFSTNTVTGVGSEVANSTGNIAPVVVGNTHKLSLTYQLMTDPTAPSNSAVNRYTYISNLAWCRTATEFPEEPVDLMFQD